MDDNTTNSSSDHELTIANNNPSKSHFNFKPFLDIIKSKSNILQTLIIENTGLTKSTNAKSTNNKGIKIENETYINGKSLSVDEAKILQDVISVERTAFLSGFTTGLMTFMSVRYLPNKFVQKFGSNEQKAMLQKSHAIRISSVRGRIGMIVSFALELTFGMYISCLAYQAYHDRIQLVESEINGDGHKSNSVYMKLASIPKVKGNSVISNNFCQVCMVLNSKVIMFLFCIIINKICKHVRNGYKFMKILHPSFGNHHRKICRSMKLRKLWMQETPSTNSQTIVGIEWVPVVNSKKS